MTNSHTLFNRNIESINALENIYVYFSDKVEALDISEILRAEFVLIVSAFDYYIHDIVRNGMLEMFEGTKPQNKNYDQFCISLKTLSIILTASNPEERRSILDLEIKKITSKDSYQSPANVEKALGLIDFTNVWSTISPVVGLCASDIKNKLALVVQRRNKIAHEADIDTVTNMKTEIDREIVDDVKSFIVKIVTAIDSLL